MTKILFISYDQLFSDLLKAYLSMSNKYILTHYYDQISKKDVFNIVVIDLDSIDDINLNILSNFNIRNRDKIIIITYNDNPDIIQLIKSTNVTSIVHKTDKLEDFLKILDLSASDGLSHSSNFINKLLSNDNSFPRVFTSLSDREKEVLFLISKGYNTKDISKKLYISIETVKTHRKNIRCKLDIKGNLYNYLMNNKFKLNVD